MFLKFLSLEQELQALLQKAVSSGQRAAVADGRSRTLRAALAAAILVVALPAGAQDRAPHVERRRRRHRRREGQ
jgi:hypothetical protein